MSYFYCLENLPYSIILNFTLDFVIDLTYIKNVECVPK